MISYNSAFEKCMASAGTFNPGKTIIKLSDAPGYVLAEDIRTSSDIPPFSKSAMDGFAILKQDAAKEIEVKGTIAAGQDHHLRISPGECYRIMTGAAIPVNTEAVVMKEDTDEKEGKIRITKSIRKENIIWQGEDAKAGEALLKKGTCISGKHIGIIATAGLKEIDVYSKPRVGVLNTGSELAEPGSKPGKTGIFNSNGPQTMALLQQMNIKGNYYGIAPDDKDKTRNIIRRSVAENDVTIITGGVSVGDYDFVPEIIKEQGFDIHFSKVAVQPGKPFTLASKREKFILGFPGNPVSSYVIFKIFAEAMLIKMMKGNYDDPQFALPLGKPLNRKRYDRDKWLPVNIVGGQVIPVDYHGSAHIHSISFATHLMRFPAGISELKKGEQVHVRPL